MPRALERSHPSRPSWRVSVRRLLGCGWSETSQKSRGVLRGRHAARYAWIDKIKRQYPVIVSCEVLEVSASGSFNWLRHQRQGSSRPAGRLSDEALLTHIRAIDAEVKGKYGAPCINKELLARAIRVSKDRVRKLMQQHGIKAKTKRKFVVKTDSRHNGNRPLEPKA